jgi:hypothetical protein
MSRRAFARPAVLLALAAVGAATLLRGYEDGVCGKLWVGGFLQCARYDRFTRWPAEFRPEEHGARVVE